MAEKTYKHKRTSQIVTTSKPNCIKVLEASPTWVTVKEPKTKE